MLYDTDGAAHGIARAGLDQAPDSPLSGQWVAYLTDVCQSVLTPARGEPALTGPHPAPSPTSAIRGSPLGPVLAMGIGCWSCV